MTSIIKVDQIQNAAGNTIVSTDASTVTIKNPAGTTALTIDGDGIVSTAQRPAFSVYRDSSGTEGLNGTIIFNGVYSNVGSHYDTSTGIFTAPVTGFYQFNFVGFGCNDGSGNYVAAGASVNVSLQNQTTSSEMARSYSGYVSTVSYPNLSLSTATQLTANDQVYVLVGGKYVYSDSSNLYLKFSGYLIG